jgi:hypothetical protein
MSAEEYASKELHEWREATIKKDIEVRTAIKVPDLVGSRTFKPDPMPECFERDYRSGSVY